MCNDELTEQRHEIWHKIARQVWAIILLLAELDTGEKPNWKRK